VAQLVDRVAAQHRAQIGARGGQLRRQLAVQARERLGDEVLGVLEAERAELAAQPDRVAVLLARERLERRLGAARGSSRFARRAR
jgi:methyl coenzyme M reductase subunit C-like uncharacterized protein (methanogenesis marker protein 7)